jgi:ribosomal protein S18 acetylase RimI-like enzyme
MQRAYRGNQDQHLMIALAHTDPTVNLHVSDLPYRLSSWAFDDLDNVGIWVDERDQLVAWAVLQTPFWAVDYVMRSDAPIQLHQHLLTWADHRAQAARGMASARPKWFINVFSDQQQRIADLEAAGWACQANVGDDSWSKVFMVRSLDSAPPDASIPTGFTIRPLGGPSEVAAYVALHRAIFESESMTAAWRHSTLQQPAYVPTLDLVAVAPDGRLAAFCVCWFDAVGPTDRPCGQIEPLGVHADVRGHGLGRAMLTEGLQRLHQHGAQDVVLETDDYRNDAFALYEAAGFQVTRNVLVYRKDYADE